jgi:hypothetical protein
MSLVTTEQKYIETGAYSVVGVTGTMAAGLGAASPIFSLRWATAQANARALIDRITTSVASLGTGFTAGVGLLEALFARSFTATDYGGVSAPAMTSAVPSETGGTLGAGTYYYKVAAIGAWGESVASAESSGATITGSTGSVVVTYGAVAGATGYRVYRGTASGLQNVYYNDAASTFTDTGATPDGTSAPGANPPAGGLTLSGNNAKRSTPIGTTVLTSALLSTTATLTAGTRTLDAQPFGARHFGVSTATNTVHLSTADLWNPYPTTYPLVLTASEGIVIRATVPATGTWQGIVSVDWREVLG